MFTEKEVQIARMKLQGLMNKEIAQKLGVSDAYISQTLSRWSAKIKTVQDSVGLLMKMNIIQEGPKYVMTEKGRKLAKVPKKKYRPLPEMVSTMAVFSTDFRKQTSAGTFVILGTGQPIQMWGRSESQIAAATEKKEIKTSPTSDHMLPMLSIPRSVRTAST